MEGPAPFSGFQVVPSFGSPSPFSGFASPFPTSSFSSPFDSTTHSIPTSPFDSRASPFEQQCTLAGRVRTRDCFEAQQEQLQRQLTMAQDNEPMNFCSPMKKRKQDMDVDNKEIFGQPNTSTREKRKRGGAGEDIADKPPKVDRTTKQRKFIHKKPDAKDIPKARLVHVRFGPDITQTVEAKILYKEPWGVMVQLLEGREELNAEKGRRYWTKFSGHVHPITNVPILDAVHAC